MLLVTGALAAPAVAGATDPAPTGGTAAPEADPAFVVEPNLMLGRVAQFSGTLPGAAGRTVTIERLDGETGAWVAIATAPVGPDGRYVATWLPDVTGRVPTRATVAAASTESAETAFALAAPAEALLTVYRRANATWFGPGFYGRRTACGVRMTRRLLGVAHKRLPCGTLVAFTYKGRAITVPVVDRGPFTKGRAWDLTSAAAKALGFAATGRLGAIPLG